VTSSIPLGRIAGIRVGVNWSWLVVFALIAWTLASAVFPDQNPGRSKAAYVAMALVASLLFYASLLAHELGHALQARRDGMEIEGITLWLFGGVAKFRGQFPSAGAEFRIAVAGPLVSLALGLFFSLVPAAVSLPEVVDGVAAWLGYINLTLLVFNLLPALPLDGGRILRSILWQVRGDFASATRISASIARVIAYLLIAAGIFLLVFRDEFSGAWLAFVGWFLLQAAGAESRFLATREALGDARVADLMVRNPVAVRADLTLGEFMDEVAWVGRYTTYPVVDATGRPLGLLPFRRVAEVPRAEWDRRHVRDCVVPLEQVPRLDQDEPLADALADLSQSDVRRGLVIDDGRLVGLLSITDLMRALEVGRSRRRSLAAGAGPWRRGR
jgi:Zn-dependent protease